MNSNHPKCSRCVDKQTINVMSVRNGRTKNARQRYKCSICKKTFVHNPIARGYGDSYDKQIISFLKEGCGIRSIGRILNVSPSTVQKIILRISVATNPPKIPINAKHFQVDELHTFVGIKKKEICVIYSWNKELKMAISLQVGTRSKLNLRTVVEPLIEAGATNINTDRYSAYVGVVPKKIHTTLKRRNNHIERQNLNLRTHIKRLSRRTICFSKSAAMLLAVVKIYFWG